MVGIAIALMLAVGCFVFLNGSDSSDATGEPTIVSVGGEAVDPVDNMGGAPTAMVGQPYSAQVVATGDDLTYSVGAGEYMRLPAGLSIDSETGLISGTCTAEAGRYNFYLTVSNAHGSANAVIGISVGDSANIPVIETAEGSLGTVKINSISSLTVSVQSEASMTIYDFGWSLKSGTLPTGMNLSYISSATVYIVGTPTATGVFNFELEATNSCGSDSKAFSITVEEGAVAPSILVEDEGELPYAVVGVQYEYQLRASGTAPLRWSFNDEDCTEDSYDLGNGLSLSYTGLISGTPTANATLSLNFIYVKNGQGTDYGSPYINIYQNGTATSLVVSPEITVVEKTKTKQFTVSLEGYGDVPQEAYWSFYKYEGPAQPTDSVLSVDSNTPAATVTLTVGANETRTQFWVVAYSQPGNNGVVGYATVNVVEQGAEIFEVTFDSNGGTGEMGPFQFADGYVYPLPTCGFAAPENKEFECWSVGGQERAVGYELTITGDVTITAVWQFIQYNVSYSDNGGSGTMIGDQVDSGSEFELDECTYTPPVGQRFAGWAVGSVDATPLKSPGQSFTVTADTIVYAIWEDVPPESYTVSFAANGGTGTMADIPGISGSYILPACAFTAPAGKEFKCWSVNDVEKNVGDSINVTANVTVTAVWKDAAAPEPAPAPEPAYEDKDVDGQKVYTNEIASGTNTEVTGIFSAAKANSGSVDVKVGTMDIAFDSDAVSAIGGQTVSLKAELKTTGLDVEGAQAVLDVTLSGATFANGKAKVTVPFSTAVPDGKVLKVYFINGNQKTDMDATYENGKVVFETSHFSKYAIMFEDAPSSGGNGGGFPVWAIVLIVVVVLAAGGAGAFFVMKNKKA